MAYRWHPFVRRFYGVVVSQIFLHCRVVIIKCQVLHCKVVIIKCWVFRYMYFRDSSVVRYFVLIYLLRFKILACIFTAYVDDFFSCVYRLFSSCLCWASISRRSYLYYVLLSFCLLQKKKKHIYF